MSAHGRQDILSSVKFNDALNIPRVEKSCYAVNQIIDLQKIGNICFGKYFHESYEFVFLTEKGNLKCKMQTSCTFGFARLLCARCTLSLSSEQERARLRDHSTPKRSRLFDEFFSYSRNCHSVLFDLEVLDDKRDCHLSWRRRLFHLKADFIGLCLLSCRSSPAFGNGAHKFRPGPPLPLTQRLWYLPTSITKLSLH